MRTPLTRQITCGLIIASPKGWLLGHATDTPYWDLPKGQREPDEDFVDAAIRECWEETGLDVSDYKQHFTALGLQPYNVKLGKQLFLFRLQLSSPLDLDQCQCRSFVKARKGSGMVLDMDAFAWVPPERLDLYVKPRMYKHLKKRGLLSN